MKLSHFHSQSVVKLVSQSIQTVPTQRLLALNSVFHGCRGGGSTHFGTWKNTLHGRVPSDSSPVWTRCQNIDTGRGKQADFHSHVWDTLSFWIIDIPGRGSAQDIRISSGLFPHISGRSTCRTNQWVPTHCRLKAPPCCNWSIACGVVGGEKGLSVRHPTFGASEDFQRVFNNGNLKMLPVQEDARWPCCQKAPRWTVQRIHLRACWEKYKEEGL